MKQASAARRYGWYLGVVAGVFAAAQVLISTTAALADAGNLISAQQGLSNGTADPQYLLGPLLPPVVASYLAMILTGAVMLYLARKAGWLAAYVSGRREAGVVAGGWVALVSATIWIALSIIVVVRAHADGTITGLFTSNPMGPLQPMELVWLLIQELAAGLIGWGLGSVVGQMGAAGAPAPLVQPPQHGSQPGPGWTTYQAGPRAEWPPSPPSNLPAPPHYSAWPPSAGTPSIPRQSYFEGTDPASAN